MNNKAFQRVLICLGHPLSLSAILLLLVNDHLLRRHWPSWWTGKISDFAWLAFAPFILAALLAWLLPTRTEQQEERVGLWAIALTGLVFSLVKTVPVCHTLTVRLLETLLGCTVGLRRDPTDLLALPTLLVAWYLWKRKAAHTHRLSHLKWVALVLATLSTVATTPMPPDVGVFCLQAQDDAIVAISGSDYPGSSYNRFISQDGGLTWQALGRGYEPLVECPRDDQWILTDPNTPSVQYRFTSETSIERSDDGGHTWQQEVATALSEAQISYYRRLGPRSITVVAGPLSALIHRPTGNLVVAMGHEGVLVRTPDGTWRWAAVGPYSRAPLDQADVLLDFLSGEIVFAMLLPLTIIGFLGRRAGKTSPLGYIVLVLAWMLWSVAFLVLSPAVSHVFPLDLEPIIHAAAFAVAVVVVPVGLKRALDLLIVSARVLGIAVAIALSGSLLFLLPYVLWSQGSIPYYRTATAFALALVLAVIVAGDRWLRHAMPALPSKALLRKALPRAAWKLWVQWLLGNAVGVGLALLIAYVAAMFPVFDSPDPVWWFREVLVMAATGALISSVQWYVMQRHGNWGGEWSRWTLLSSAGWSIGGILVTYLLGYPLVGRFWVAPGVASGIAQWLILRHRLNRAGWWIPANAVGWLAGALLVEQLFLAIPDFIIGLVVNGFIVGGVSGSVSGLCLVWFLRRSAAVLLPNDVESQEQQATEI